MANIRVRNAPSPTGFLHIGGARTFLYNFLFARKNQGTYLLRIEDTDQVRLVPGSIENIVHSLSDLGISVDEGPYWDGTLKFRGDKGPYIQSERLSIYQTYAQELLVKKAAYYCFCSKERLEQLRKDQEAQKQPPKYDKHCLNLTTEDIEQRLKKNEPYVLRLNVPADRMVEFNDLVYGTIKISTNEIDDQVLLKSDGFPTYHLAVVIDDHLMEITHIIRANEWIPSTPKHILLYEAFGWTRPEFVHLPPILSKATGKKLSKREGDVSVQDFFNKGYLPEALVNFLAFQGWNPKTEQEIFSMSELIESFSLDKVNRAGAIFDLDKLDWFNSMYIRKLSVEDLFEKIKPFLPETATQPKDFVLKILKLEQERLKKLSEIGERVKYFFAEPEYDPTLLIWKKSDKAVIRENLQKIQEFLKSNSSDEETIKKFIAENNLKTGEVLWPLRVALSGLEASPGPFEIMDAFTVLSDGKERILKRIQSAIDKLHS